MNRMKKIVLISSAALVCYTTGALAAVGDPDQSILRNEQVQNTLQKNQGAHAKNAWNHMSDEQKAAAKQQENKRLHKIGSNKAQEYQNQPNESQDGSNTQAGSSAAK